MTTLEKVNRLKNFVETSGVNVLDVVDLTLEKLINREKQLLLADAAELQAELALFEERFGLPSADFHAQFERGELGDEMDYIEWASLYDMFLRTQALLAILA